MSDLRFVKPIDGDVLFECADGTEKDGVLYAQVHVQGPANCHIAINSVAAEERTAGEYYATIPLDAYRNGVNAVCEETCDSVTMHIYWFRGGYKTYRVGVDDVIWCLENIYNHQNEYASIFDDPYLSMYRDLHAQYGSHVHMHIYYQTVDGKFNLSMFPDKYKEEFHRNSNWLRFSFHALADLPDSPYKQATYEQVMREGRMVEREILRFAGPEVMDAVTSQHWADSALPGTRAFRDLGFKVLDAYFIFDSDGNPRISYYLNAEQAGHAASRDFWVDNEEDIIFVKDDIILNDGTYSLADIDAVLNARAEAEDHAFMYLLIHEQYFYPHYEAYEPDYRDRLFRGVQWCEEHGYRSSWISDFAFDKVT